MSFSTLGVVKFIATGIVGLGTGRIVSGIIKEHVKPETLLDKVTVVAASAVIGAMATKATKDYADEAIDEIVVAVTAVVDNVKTTVKLGKINRDESTFVKEGLDATKFTKNDKDKWVPRKEPLTPTDV